MTTHKRPSAGQVTPETTIRRPVRVRPRAAFDPFLALLQAHGLPVPQTEFVFHPTRKWRADYCWPAAMLIVEREGGFWRGGRGGGSAMGGHSSGLGIQRDMEKSNAAQLLGYVYLRFAPRDLDSGAALSAVKQALR